MIQFKKIKIDEKHLINKCLKDNHNENSAKSPGLC
jgi:hypothetical protein